MVLCPVYYVYNVLADTSIPLGRVKHFLSAEQRHWKGMEWEQEMQAEGGVGETSKGGDAKYTHPFFGSTCASSSLCGLHERRLTEQWVTDSLCREVLDTDTLLLQDAFWRGNWFLIQICLVSNTTVKQIWYQIVQYFSLLSPQAISLFNSSPYRKIKTLWLCCTADT